MNDENGNQIGRECEGHYKIYETEFVLGRISQAVSLKMLCCLSDDLGNKRKMS